MLESHDISIACLMKYLAFTVGIALLAAGEIFGPHLAVWGLAVICLACTYSVHRALRALDGQLQHAFNAGRDYEHHSSLTTIH